MDTLQADPSDTRATPLQLEQPRSNYKVYLLLVLAMQAGILLVPPLLEALTNGPLNETPQFVRTWGLVATGQLVAWGVTIFVTLRADISASWKVGSFWVFAILNFLAMLLLSVPSLWFPESMPKAWPIDFANVLGPPMVAAMTFFVVVGSSVGSILVGIAGSQFEALATPPKNFGALVAVLGRVKRSFLSLALLLTLGVFSTDRLYTSIRAASPGAYEFSQEIVLYYGLAMSFQLVLFYLPVTLRYHDRAQSFLDEKHGVPEEFEKNAVDGRQQMQLALGLSALSGVEGLLGVMGPVLGALLSLCASK